MHAECSVHLLPSAEAKNWTYRIRYQKTRLCWAPHSPLLWTNWKAAPPVYLHTIAQRPSRHLPTPTLPHRHSADPDISIHYTHRTTVYSVVADTQKPLWTCANSQDSIP